MKSQINLLSDEFIPKFEWVCSEHFIGAIVGVILLCSGVYGFSVYRHQQITVEVASLKKDIARQQVSIDELTLALTTRVADPLLESKLAHFSQQTRSRGQLLNHIRNLSVLKQRSFSVLFDSLAQSSSSQLWLTHFMVTENELNIEGEIATPSALPLWISELSKTNFFKGQAFNLANVEREDERLVFQLNSVNKANATSNSLAQTELSNER